MDSGGKSAWSKALRPLIIAALIVLVVLLAVAVHRVLGRSHCPSCEGFYWTEWLGGTERENLCGAPSRRARETYDQRRRRHEGFGASAWPSPFGGFPDYNPRPPADGRSHEDILESLAREGFINGAIPCCQPPCSSVAGSCGPREGFSPDAPGACSAKRSRAARAENDALRALSGQ